MIISRVFHTYFKRFRNKINLALILFLYRAVFLYIIFGKFPFRKQGIKKKLKKLIPLRFRKEGKMWSSGARETH